MKKIFIFIILLLPIQLTGQKIHFILVANTEDTTIGSSCSKDYGTIYNLLNKTAKKMNYQANPITLKGSSFSAENVQNMLTGLQTDSNDIIFFYYTGHGINEEGEKWPTMKFRDNNITIDAIHVIIANKPHKLCITLGDCCNVVSTENLLVEKGIVVEPDTQAQDQSNAFYHSLFSNTSGDILISSSIIGQKSYSTPQDGSFYTRVFQTVFTNATLAGKAVSWQDFLTLVSNKIEQLPELANQQKPQFVLNISENKTIVKKPKKIEQDKVDTTNIEEEFITETCLKATYFFHDFLVDSSSTVNQKIKKSKESSLFTDSTRVDI